MGISKGPSLVIDHMIMYQLLGMPEFWTALPEALTSDLRAEARTAHAKALALAKGETCVGCSSIRSVISPVHNAIWQRVHVAVQLHPELAVDLVDLITTKRGYRPTKIIVYYKTEAGRQNTLTF